MADAFLPAETAQLFGKKKEVTGKFARWILSLQEYAFEIRHVEGVNNFVADALSRNPDESCIVPSGSAIGHVV
jgi:hypothetical protein